MLKMICLLFHSKIYNMIIKFTRKDRKMRKLKQIKSPFPPLSSIEHTISLRSNNIKRVTYFAFCLLLIGLYLSCTGKKSDDGGTAPIIDYDPLGVSSFSVVDENDVPISDTNAIPFDISFSFLLTFDQSLGNMANHVSSLAKQITLTGNTGNGILPLPFLKVEPTQTPNQVKITSAIYLGGGITYQLTLKKGLTVNNYQTTNDITYLITTKKNSDSSLIVIYDSKEFFPNRNDIPILLPIGSDPSSVTLTLKVGEGASLQQGNNNLPLNENNQYTTNMGFSGSATHSFTVTAQDESTSVTYTIRVLQRQMDSKEIISFAFRETDNSHLKANIVMDVDANNRTVTKTVTNVEGITGLVPYIVHSGSNISPASGVAQDFSTANTYTVTATDKTTYDYTVTLTSYYGVIFNANGGLISGDPTATEYILYGEKASPPLDPSQEHYGFKGWYDAITGGNVFDFTTTDITTQTTVYAQWTNKQYKVSFDTAGGTAISPVMVKSLTPIDRPIDPATNHYVLEDWYIDSSFTTRYDFNWVVSNDLTLYAKYINKQYQVRFHQGTDLLDTVSVDSETTIPTSNYPTSTVPKQLYKWYSDNGLANIYDKNSPVVDNLDLYAEVLDTDGTFKSIIDAGVIPSDLVNYDDMSEMIFSHYIAGADVIARYVKGTTSGTGDGSSWGNAANDIQAMIDGINDANESKIYVVLMASGTYKPAASYVMKNHVALVGGFTAGSSEDYDRSGKTHLDGNNDKRVFNNNNNGLVYTALLYGVVITNGNANNEHGGGMENLNSSPTLINVTFSGNKATGNNKGGGGMRNDQSSPTLINVTFSGNEADFGGGMDNNNSSLTLINVTFSDNRATRRGGGIYNSSSYLTLINVTFLDNEAIEYGGGIIHDSGGKPLTLINTILWENNNGNIYVQNNEATRTEIVNLYHSLIEGGANASDAATGIRLGNADTNTYHVAINSKEVIDDNPGLGNLADNGGEVNTISISDSSPAKNKGVYVRGVKVGNTYPEANLYYSEDNTDWYSDPGLTTQESLPSKADNLTTTDARGYSRVGRPDMGTYEEGGTAP